MSAYKFSKDDFDEIEGQYVYATAVDTAGLVATYELLDAENVTYKEVDVIDSMIMDGVLTVIADKAFDGQAVIV